MADKTEMESPYDVIVVGFGVAGAAAAIEAAVKTEAEYLAKLGAGKIEGMGAGASGGQTKTLEETDKELVAGFMRLGMSEAEAKAAVKGA